ncbi:uncharacterized protein LOC121861773 isoform X2 [Homarus americanus]|uniref:uncharacterized protein LOC121861773 isoform X1 n=1 Tax=Homarus americanus TaxID=6706 RepID=UPI001C49017E|nr:uncharacterized protein LOC121861773 isoform X1 [Homarus americanus]XP_042215595.1 uncharacterized protein LOC121861773 isoform X2 [Homarus americanus]
MSEAALNVVTDEVVRAALVSDRGSQATLVSWASETFTSKFDGATSAIYNIRTQYSLAGQAREVSYVVKISPSRAQQNDFFSIIFAKECNFYAEVIPALNSVLAGIGQRPLDFPKCVYYSLETGKEMILLENLREKGYKMESRRLGIDTAHTTLVLKELGRLHAASALLQTNTPDQDLTDKFDCLKKEWTREFNLGCDFGAFVDDYLDSAIEMFKKIGGCDTVVEWIKRIKPQVWDMYEQQLVKKPPFALITHGDCWINNLLFRYDESNNPVEVKLLDLQGCRKASLATDLQHLLNLNVTGPIRRPNLNNFLAAYHTSFSAIMQAGGSTVPFSLEELRQEYIARGFYGVLYSIMWLPNMVRRPEDMIDILGNKEDRKISERNNVLQMVDRNPLLKPRLLSVVEEWVEHGVIS